MKYPKGQSQIVYIRGWRVFPKDGMLDPTMVHCSIDELEARVNTSITKSYRPPDKIERTYTDECVTVRLAWYVNEEEYTTDLYR